MKFPVWALPGPLLGAAQFLLRRLAPELQVGAWEQRLQRLLEHRCLPNYSRLRDQLVRCPVMCLRREGVFLALGIRLAHECAGQMTPELCHGSLDNPRLLSRRAGSGTVRAHDCDDNPWPLGCACNLGIVAQKGRQELPGRLCVRLGIRREDCRGL